MPSQTFPALSQLEFLAYISATGELAEGFESKIGVYAVFDADKAVQYVGYSRNVALSLNQHLVRHPGRCGWLKVELCDRPNRTLLEETRAAWLAEAGPLPSGDTPEEDTWTQPIDIRYALTDAEQQSFPAMDELGQRKLLKQVARRVEASILADLESRGVTIPLRFDPKLKDDGKLNLKAE